jgi:hypothetical protein
MRKFTSDYIYGVIDTHIIASETKPDINYAFMVHVYDEFGYAVVTFTYGGDKEWWFKLVKGEPLIKLTKYVEESLEIINNQ